MAGQSQFNAPLSCPQPNIWSMVVFWACKDAEGFPNTKLSCVETNMYEEELQQCGLRIKLSWEAVHLFYILITVVQTWALLIGSGSHTVVVPTHRFLKYSDIMRDNCCYAKKSEPDATLKGSSVETYCSEQAIWIIHWCNVQYIMETWWQPIVSQCDCPNFWSEILWLSHYKMTNTVHNYLSVDCQYFRGAERMLTGFCLLSGFSGPSTSHRFQTVFFVPNITEVAALRHKRITPSQQQWRQGITDHMNLGSLLRSAAFFGVEGGPKGSHEGWRGGLSHGLQC